METRKVSWLPPDDPDAEITDPEIRKEPEIPARKESSRSRSDDHRRDRDRSSRKRRDERDRSPKRRKKYEKEEEEGFDPMDPSAYSDAPKGN